MEMTLGLGLLSLADPSRGGDLMDRISGVRNSLAADIGIVLPKVRVRDEVLLGDLEYEIRIAGIPIVGQRFCQTSILPSTPVQHWCCGW